ncbi:DUF6382 domain-containing protein [Thermincola ferriacetica]
MENTLFDFKVEYVGDLRRSYLELDKENLKADQIIGFQAEMIANNQIPGVLNLEIREKNAHAKLYYNLTGLISLANYLKRQKIGKTEFTLILERILSPILESKKYFLNSNSFLLDDNLIYINPDSGEVFLAYLPLELEQDITRTFKTFVTDLLVGKANIDTGDNFVQRLLQLLKAEDLNLPEFRKQLMKLIGVDDKLPEENPEQYNIRNFPPRPGTEPMPTQDEATPTPKLQPKPAPVIPLYNGLNFSPKPSFQRTVLPQPVKKMRAEKRINNQPPVPTNNKNSVRTKALGVMAVISVVSAMISNSGIDFARVLQNFTNKELAAAGGLLIFVITLSFYYRKVKRASAKGGSSVNQKDDNLPQTFNHLNMSKVDIETQPQRKTTIADLVISPLPSKPATGSPNYDRDETTLLEDYSDETTLLVENTYPVLKAANGGDKIILDKSTMVIGRNKETCDWVIANKSIGRAHAEIKCIDGVYYIVDLDSRNGTFINGDKLISNKQYALRENDKITFADVDYLFCSK